MTTPKDIQDIIRGICAEFVGEASWTWDAPIPNEDIARLLAWLEAQADAPEPWEPVEVGAKIDVQGSIERKVLYRMDENVLAILAVDDNTVRGAEMLYLPDDVRLYRRMEVTE
jgi:hypothetical protein